MIKKHSYTTHTILGRKLAGFAEESRIAWSADPGGENDELFLLLLAVSRLPSLKAARCWGTLTLEESITKLRFFVSPFNRDPSLAFDVSDPRCGLAGSSTGPERVCLWEIVVEVVGVASADAM